jgi:hypothetical protein
VQAETRRAQAETRRAQAETRCVQAETRCVQAETRRHEAVAQFGKLNRVDIGLSACCRRIEPPIALTKGSAALTVVQLKVRDDRAIGSTCG